MNPMVHRTVPNKPLHARAPQKQKGLGMLEVLLFIAILGGLAATGYLEWQSRETIKTAREERLSLSQADTALITFATVNHRLPCPDTNRDGLEDCVGNAQKGWLPSLTLQLAGADPGVSTGQLRYLVQRGGATFDLASLGDDWRPLRYNKGPPATFNAIRSTGTGTGAYPPDILTLADMCQRLGVGAGTALASGMAQVGSSPARTVAYAVVHPGIADKDGDGSLFEGANGTATGNTVEDPARTPLLANYDDLVLERSFASLQAAFNCQPLFQSINTIALGLDVVDQVDGMRVGSIIAGALGVATAAVGVAVTSFGLVTAIIKAGSDSGNAVEDSTLCGASLGISANACAAIGFHVGAAVAAGTITVSHIGTIAANVAAAAAAGTALVLADQSQNASALTTSCPKVDVAGPLAQATSERNAAVAKRNELQAALTAKQAELPPATNALNTAYINWLAAVRDGTSISSIDSQYTALRNAAEAWYTNNQTVIGAGLQVEAFKSARDAASLQVAEYNVQLSNRNTEIATLQSQIAALQLQIDPLPEGQDKDLLRQDLGIAEARLRLVSDPIELQKERNKAEADRAKAVFDLDLAVIANNTAQSTLGTSRTAYQTAYTAMIDAAFGPYNIGPPPVVIACSGAVPVPCAVGSLQTQVNVIAAVRNVYGLSPDPLSLNTGSLLPNADSKFTRPKTIQKEIDDLQAQVDVAAERVTRAQGLVTSLQTQVDNPPACNITGTGVRPWSPALAASLLRAVDTKGATR